MFLKYIRSEYRAYQFLFIKVQNPGLLLVQCWKAVTSCFSPRRLQKVLSNLAALGLHCCVWVLASYSEYKLVSSAVPGLLIAMACLVAACRL